MKGWKGRLLYMNRRRTTRRLHDVLFRQRINQGRVNTIDMIRRDLEKKVKNTQTDHSYTCTIDYSYWRIQYCNYWNISWNDFKDNDSK